MEMVNVEFYVNSRILEPGQGSSSALRITGKNKCGEESTLYVQDLVACHPNIRNLYLLSLIASSSVL